MAFLTGQAASILWAQWRSILNYSGRKHRGGIPLSLLVGFLWYGFWGLGAFAVAWVVRDPANVAALEHTLPRGLLLVFLYWQVVPIMMATSGLSLDLSRLLVYPIPHRRLFRIEVALRASTSIEMLLITAGLIAGVVLNPDLPWWGVAGITVFACLNLFISAGLRDLLKRLLARKGFREAAVFVVILLAAVPQFLLTRTTEEEWRTYLDIGTGRFWPWAVTAKLTTGNADAGSLSALVLWTAVAYWFSRSQFERTLLVGAVEGSGTRSRRGALTTLLDIALVVPGLLLRDPLAGLIEKEVRSLARAPRFRLLFLMGFSFGLLVALPLAMGSDGESAVRTNFLTIVSAYALLLLGEVCFWNIFGMDRSAVQSYFAMPVEFSTVLVAKNVASAFFIVLEILVVAAVCVAIRMPVSFADVCEAFAVIAVLVVFMLACGNMLSTRYPRAMDPSQSWRSGGSMGRTQAYLLVLYPLVAAPVMLAYGARYAFDNSSAFYGVLAFDLILGFVLYGIALESAAEAAQRGRERFVELLSRAEGPVGS